MILPIDTAKLLLELLWQQLWLGTALVMIVGVGLRASKRWNAATRHWIWALTLLIVAALPLAIFLPQPSQPDASVAQPSAAESRNVSSSVIGAFANQTPGAIGDRTAADARIDQSIRWLATALLALWIAGAAWMLFRLVASARFAAILHRTSYPAELPGAAAGIRLSHHIRSPMVVGLLRPDILLPASLPERISGAELNRILAHELAHIRRRDHWIMLIQRFIEALYFYHPALRFTARCLDDEREISCDDRAAMGEPTRYANSLVRICREIVERPADVVLAVGAVSSPRQLTRRIHHLLDRRRNHAPRVSRAGLTVTAAVLLALAGGAAELMPRISRADDDSRQLYSYSYDTRYEYGTPLIAAAAEGNLEELRRLVAGGADVNEAFPDHEPRTPLNAAARAGQRDAVEYLLSNGADVNRVIRGDATALIDAARSGRADIVEMLVRHGASVNQAVDGDGTALMSAVTRGDTKGVRFLLENGADPSLGVPGDGTPLIAAARRGDTALVATLLDYGADINGAVEGDGNPLIMAAAMGHTDVVRLLLDRGASVNTVVPGDEHALISAAR